MKIALRILMILGVVFVATLPHSLLGVFHVPYPSILSKFNVAQMDLLWSTPYYINLFSGCLALISGCLLYIKQLKFYNDSTSNHFEKLFTYSVIITASTGIYLSFYASGGWPAILGFGVLGILMLYITIQALITEKKKSPLKHRELMFYSFSLCFSVIAFNIWNPVFSLLFTDSNIAYQLAAWESWILNLFLAIFIIRK